MTSLAAVVFDFDGVILDSETPAFEAHRLLFERCGQVLTSDEWCAQVGVWVDGESERWFARLSRLPGAPDSFEAFEAEKRRLFQQLVSTQPMPGIVDLLDALGAESVPLGVASTSPARWVVPALERLGLTRRFGAVVTADDVSRRKPAPDVYLEAIRRLGADSRRSVAIEDSAPGLASARAAGMKVVAIPHWLTERHNLSQAHLVVANASELTMGRLSELVREPAA